MLEQPSVVDPRDGVVPYDFVSPCAKKTREGCFLRGDLVSQLCVLIHVRLLWEDWPNRHHVERTGGIDADSLKLPAHRVALCVRADLEVLSHTLER